MPRVRLSLVAGVLVATGAVLVGARYPTGPAATASQGPRPDTSGAAIWTYLNAVHYEATWQTWPGKGTFYKGQEPHGMLLTTYLNDVAYDAVTNKAGRFSAGAIIVKQNYAPDSTLAAVTTIYKVAGYNAEAGDWFWVKHLANGTVDMNGMAQGRVAMCIGCHQRMSGNDYVFTGSLK